MRLFSRGKPQPKTISLDIGTPSPLTVYLREKMLEHYGPSPSMVVRILAGEEFSHEAIREYRDACETAMVDFIFRNGKA